MFLDSCHISCPSITRTFACLDQMNKVLLAMFQRNGGHLSNLYVGVPRMFRWTESNSRKKVVMPLLNSQES